MATSAQDRDRPRIGGQVIPLFNGDGTTYENFETNFMQVMKVVGSAGMRSSYWFAGSTTRKGIKLRQLEYKAGWIGGAAEPVPPAGFSGLPPRPGGSRLPAWVTGARAGPETVPNIFTTPAPAAARVAASPTAAWTSVDDQVEAILADEEELERYFESRSDTFTALQRAATYLGGIEDRFLADKPDAPKSEQLQGCPRRLLRRLRELSTGTAIRGTQAPLLRNAWEALGWTEMGTMVDSFVALDKLITSKYKALKIFGAQHELQDRDLHRKLLAVTPMTIKNLCLIGIMETETYAEAYTMLIKIAGVYDAVHPVARTVHAAVAGAGGAAPAPKAASDSKKGRKELICFVDGCGEKHSAMTCPKLSAWTKAQKTEFVKGKCAALGWTRKPKTVTAAAAAVVQIPPPTATPTVTVPAQAATVMAPIKSKKTLFAYVASHARFEPAGATDTELFEFKDGDFFPYDE